MSVQLILSKIVLEYILLLLLREMEGDEKDERTGERTGGEMKEKVGRFASSVHCCLWRHQSAYFSVFKGFSAYFIHFLYEV